MIEQTLLIEKIETLNKEIDEKIAKLKEEVEKDARRTESQV